MASQTPPTPPIASARAKHLAALRQRFLERAQIAVEELAQHLSSAELAVAIGESDDMRMLWEGLQGDAIKDRLPKPVMRKPPHAKREWIAERQAMLDSEGGVLKVGEVAELLGISRQAVNDRRRANKLLAINPGRRGYRYPVWQFEPSGDLLPGFADVLDALQPHSSWESFAFFLRPDPVLGATGPESPLAALRRGELEKVSLRARVLGQQGGA